MWRNVDKCLAARTKSIPSTFKLTCSSCSSPSTPETLHHLLLECRAWRKERKAHIHQLLDLIPPPISSSADISILLIGGIVGGHSLPNWANPDHDDSHTPPLFHRVIQFFNSIANRHRATLWQHSLQRHSPHPPL